MKRKEQSGTAIIELNHSGIPDSKLKPEKFDEWQEAVLAALSTELQEKIRKGCPVSVIDLSTGNAIATFNRKNVAITKWQTESFARSIFESIQEYFKDPENEKKYQEWKREHEDHGGKL